TFPVEPSGELPEPGPPAGALDAQPVLEEQPEPPPPIEEDEDLDLLLPEGEEEDEEQAEPEQETRRPEPRPSLESRPSLRPEPRVSRPGPSSDVLEALVQREPAPVSEEDAFVPSGRMIRLFDYSTCAG
ncbi:hypothetical protein JW921_00445, partial [Candidatus Fermentibacterales bacterium]|nr:hypothetical protein [Candidatus Fermentibacterales bacterium]